MSIIEIPAHNVCQETTENILAHYSSHMTFGRAPDNRVFQFFRTGLDDDFFNLLVNKKLNSGNIRGFTKRHRPKWTRMIASVAAAAVLLMGVGGAAYAMPYGVVSLDVNPSIEYTINRFRYVLSVEGVNEAGKAVLAEMDSSRLLHHRIDDALEESLTQIEAGDWLTESSPDVLLAAGLATETRSEKLVQALASELQAGHEDLEIHPLAVSREDIDAAREAGMSAGRQHMLREFGERAGADAVLEDWADRPIGDLLHAFESGQPNPGQQLEAQEQHDMPNQEHAEQREEQTQPPQDETRQQPPAQEMPQSEDSLNGAGGTASREQP